jgi:superfamily II DNA/RNA helicase
MSWNKIRPELAEILQDKGFNIMNSFQESILDVMKSGRNILAEGSEGSGKSTAILYTVLEKIKTPGEGSPRAIISCSSNDKAPKLYDALKICTFHLDLTVDLVHDKGNMLKQRNDLFDGTEIIVGTPKRLYELYIQNGYNVGELKIFILDDAIQQFKNGNGIHLKRITESLPKCQFMILTSPFSDKRLEEFIDEIGPFQKIEE